MELRVQLSRSTVRLPLPLPLSPHSCMLLAQYRCSPSEMQHRHCGIALCPVSLSRLRARVGTADERRVGLTENVSSTRLGRVANILVQKTWQRAAAMAAMQQQRTRSTRRRCSACSARSTSMPTDIDAVPARKPAQAQVRRARVGSQRRTREASLIDPTAVWRLGQPGTGRTCCPARI